MSRRILRMFRTTVGIGSLLFLGMPFVSGCVPAFQGLQPVSKKEISPEAKEKQGSAEILFLEDYRRERYAQVGQRTSMLWRVYKRIRINSHKGLSNATQQIHGQLDKLQIRTQCPDGRKLELSESDLQQRPELSEVGMNFIGPNSAKFTAPGAGVGCVIDFFWEAEVIAMPPTYTILQRLPLRRAKMVYEYNDGKELRASLHHMEPVWMRLAQKLGKKKGAEKPSKMLSVKEKERHVRLRHVAKDRRIELQLNNLPSAWKPRALQGMMRSQLLPASFASPALCRIELVQTIGMRSRAMLTAWGDLDSAYMRSPSYLVDEREEVNEDGFPKLAKKLTSKASDRRGRIMALYNHLRTRMHVTGQGNSSRRKLRKVYDIKQGTTYEINMMYIVMLRSLGIRAYLAKLPSYDAVYQNGSPSNAAFKSVATYIAPSSEGKWEGYRQERRKAKTFLAAQKADYSGGRNVSTGKIINPANKALPFGMLPRANEGVHAFVVDGTGGRFLMTPSLPAERNTRTTVIKANIAKDGSLSGSYKSKLTGHYALQQRSGLQQVAKHDWAQKSMGRQLRKVCGATTQVMLNPSPNLGLDDPSAPLNIQYKFQTQSCVPYAKRAMLFRPLAAWLGGMPRLKSKDRQVPIHLGTVGMTKVAIDYKFPKGFSLVRDLGNHSVDGPSLKASLKSKRITNGIRIRFMMNVQKSQISAEEYGKVKAFYGKLGKLMKRQILVVSGSALATREAAPAPVQTASKR